ncbi:MAG: hypothetical protein V1646_00805 [bacterium]
MKKIIIAIVFLGASFSLSVMASSFKTEFDSFMRASSVNVCYDVVSVQSLIEQIKPSEIPYDAYVKFSKFLLDESLKSYELSYIAQNRIEVLNVILLGNLMQIHQGCEIGAGCQIADLAREVEKLYRVMVPGFCVCLVNAMDEQKGLNRLVPKL